jgi:hypothetical protein
MTSWLHTELWLEEAERRDAAWDASAGTGRPAADVFEDAIARWRGMVCGRW